MGKLSTALLQCRFVVGALKCMATPCYCIPVYNIAIRILLQPLFAGEYVHGVNTQWLIVDRVLAERPSSEHKGQNEFYIKWKDLGHDQCT